MSVALSSLQRSQPRWSCTISCRRVVRLWHNSGGSGRRPWLEREDEMSDYAVVSLKSVDNAGAQFGLPEESFELRMGRVPLAGEIAGVSYMRLGPGWRQPFGHRHKQQEEVYVLVNGSARMKVGDEIVEMTPWTAVRVPPSTVRALEA